KPAKENILRAFCLTPLSELKIVLLGQDPYPTPGNACGLSFSVPRGIRVPASLKMIFKCLSHCGLLKGEERKDGCLEGWARQGILLLNAALTMHSKSNDHKRIWHKFTIELIKMIAAVKPETIFMLFGGDAQKYESAARQNGGVI